MRLFGNAIQNYYGTLSITTPGGGSLAINSSGNVAITAPAPASGAALTATGIDNKVAALFFGANTANGLGLQVSGQFTGPGNTGLVQFYDTNNTNGVNILMAGNGATTPNKYIRVVAPGTMQWINSGYSATLMQLTDAGNLTINAPSSGTALAANGIASAYTAIVNAAGAAGTQLGLKVVGTTTNAADILLQANVVAVSNPLLIFGDGHFNIGFNGSAATIVGSAAGNVTIAAPSGGSALAINGTLAITAASPAVFQMTPTGAGATTQPVMQYFTDNNLYIDAPVTGTPTGGQIFFRTGPTATKALTLAASGNVTIAAPSTDIVSLSVGSAVLSVASDRSMAVSGTSTDVRLGVSTTTSGNAQINLDTQGVQNWVIGNARADGSLRFSSSQALGSLDRVTISSAGGLFMAGATGGDQGSGTLNATGLFINGIAVGALPTVKTKAATTNRQSTIVLANDPDLTFAIPAAGTYKIEVVARCASAGGAGLAANMNYSGGITNSAVNEFIETTSVVGGSDAFGGPIAAAVTTSQVVAPATTFSESVLHMSGVLVASGTGTVAVAWAQSVSVANNTSLNIGSTMIVTRIA